MFHCGFGSGSDFGKVSVSVSASVPVPVPAPARQYLAEFFNNMKFVQILPFQC